MLKIIVFIFLFSVVVNAQKIITIEKVEVPPKPDNLEILYPDEYEAYKSMPHSDSTCSSNNNDVLFYWLLLNSYSNKKIQQNIYINNKIYLINEKRIKWVY